MGFLETTCTEHVDAYVTQASFNKAVCSWLHNGPNLEAARRWELQVRLNSSETSRGHTYHIARIGACHNSQTQHAETLRLTIFITY